MTATTAARSALLLALVCATGARADVVRDGSLGAAPAGPVGPGTDPEGVFADFLITSDLGAQRGSNLFHSFSDFDLADADAGKVATFTGPDPIGGPQSVGRIFSRVTGGAASRIDGTIRSTISGADVYLLNPNGVVLRSGAEIDIQGSFHASSADFVRFQDGISWPTAQPSGVALLSVADPWAYGFVRSAPGAIAIERQPTNPGGAPFQVALTVPAGEKLSLVGGDVSITGRGDAAREAIEIDGGVVEIASVGGPVDVPIDDVAGLDVAGLDPAQLGSVSLTNGASINVEGRTLSGGAVVVRGGRLVVAGASQVASGTVMGDADAAAVAIDIQVAGTAEVGESSSLQSVSLFSAGRGGDLRIEAERFEASGGAQVFTRTVFGPGPAGDVSVVAEQVRVASGAEVFTTTGIQGMGDGAGGDLHVQADLIEVDGGSLRTNTEGLAAAGDLTLHGGHVDIHGPLSQVTSAGGVGPGGRLSIEADTIDVRERALLSTQALGAGAAGSIVLEAGLLRVSDSRISASGAEGRGGDIALRGERFELSDGGLVTASAQGLGDAGNIDVRFAQVSLSGKDALGSPSAIVSQSITGATGAAGAITFAADQIVVRDGAQVSVASRALGSGPTGNIEISTRSLEIANSENAIRASSFSRNDAGNITITAQRGVQIKDGSITTEAAFASGGDIIILGGDRISLERSARNDAMPVVDAQVLANPLTRGGDVVLQADNVVVGQAAVRARAPGLGGSILIDTEALFVSGGVLGEVSPGIFESLGGSSFDVSGRLDKGTFQVTAPDSAVIGDLASLSDAYLDVTALLADQCAARDEPVGSLVVRGRDRVPAPPGETLRVEYLGESR